MLGEARARRRVWWGAALSAAWVTGLVLGAQSLGACQGDYPLAPTACDDWCHATLRADCRDDFPDSCVSECEERGIAQRYPECEPDWLAVGSCYETAPSSEFECVMDESVPGNICTTERERLAECASEPTSICVTDCFRQAETCGHNAVDCEQNCYTETASCPTASAAFHTCQLGVPVFCQSEGAAPPNPEDVPCLLELGALFACAGVDAGLPVPSE